MTGIITRWCSICSSQPARYDVKCIGDWVPENKPLHALESSDVFFIEVCEKCFDTEVDKVGTGRLQLR